MARGLTFAGAAMLLASVLLQALPDGEPWGGALWTAGFPLALAWYPGRTARPRWLVVVVIAGFVLAAVYVSTDGRFGAQPVGALSLVPHVLVVAVLAIRYRQRLDTADRQRVRWAVLGALLTLGVMGCLIAVSLLDGAGTIASSGLIANVVATAAVAQLPLALLAGLLAPRALAVDPVLRATVVVLCAAVPLVVGYAGAVAIGLPAWSGALLVGLGAYPAIRAGLRVGDRLVYGGRPAPAVAALELGRRLAAQEDPAESAATLAATTRELLQLERVTVDRPDHRMPGTGLPIVYRGEPVAMLSVQPRRGESALTRRDRQVLDALVATAAPALHGAVSVAALAEERLRVVLAREEERKSLRRDLHDDLAPTLAGLSLSAAGIARLVRSLDPVAASAADDLVSDVQSAIGQTRDLAYGLRPPVLDDHGLAAAIRDRTRPVGAGLVVDIEAPATRLELPAAVELAALRIVQEAVLNVRKHAEANRCDVRLALHDGVLDLEIADDGRGIPATGKRGIGLASIGERARELGGSARIGARPGGGTLVAVSLPVSS